MRLILYPPWLSFWNQVSVEDENQVERGRRALTKAWVIKVGERGPMPFNKTHLAVVHLY